MEQTNGTGFSFFEAPRHRVSWTDDKGQRQHCDFYSRKVAIIWLNRAILDCGFHDAKLRLLPKAKVS